MEKSEQPWMNYHILEAESSSALCERVIIWLSHGWQLVGGVSVFQVSLSGMGRFGERDITVHYAQAIRFMGSGVWKGEE